MKSYDGIVAGAERAGSIAGYRLAKAGLDVLADRQSPFPPPKGLRRGVNTSALRERPLDITSLSHHAVDWSDLRFRGKTVTAIHGAGPIAYLVDRNPL